MNKNLWIANSDTEIFCYRILWVYITASPDDLIENKRHVTACVIYSGEFEKLLGIVFANKNIIMAYR